MWTWISEASDEWCCAAGRQSPSLLMYTSYMPCLPYSTLLPGKSDSWTVLVWNEFNCLCYVLLSLTLKYYVLCCQSTCSISKTTGWISCKSWYLGVYTKSYHTSLILICIGPNVTPTLHEAKTELHLPCQKKKVHNIKCIFH